MGNEVTRIMGIDPGIQHTGYGVVESVRKEYRLISSGRISISRSLPFAEKLQKIYSEILSLVRKYSPEAVAIEEAFYSRNARTALVLGHARGAAILATVNEGKQVFEYSPRKIKSSVVGNGNATKEQIAYMIKKIIGTNQEIVSLDASDAIAVAICHLNQNKLRIKA